MNRQRVIVIIFALLFIIVGFTFLATAINEPLSLSYFLLENGYSLSFKMLMQSILGVFVMLTGIVLLIYNKNF